MTTEMLARFSTVDGRAALADLGIATVYDFRSVAERTTEPMSLSTACTRSRWTCSPTRLRPSRAT